MAEDHEVAVGQPAQQFAGLLAGLPVELAGVLDEPVGEVADQLVHPRGVLDGVVHVGQHAAQPGEQVGDGIVAESLEVDVHPRLHDRVGRHAGVVVDVVDADEGALVVADDDQLRVQQALETEAPSLDLGLQRLHDVGHVAADDVDRGALPVPVAVARAQQHLVVGSVGAEGQRRVGELAQLARVVARELCAGVGEVAASERGPVETGLGGGGGQRLGDGVGGGITRRAPRAVLALARRLGHVGVTSL